MEDAVHPELPKTDHGKSRIGSQMSPLAYSHLQMVARRLMSRERQNHTYRPTELVNEALIRVAEKHFNNRTHFYSSLAVQMRHILVDYAKARLSIKRNFKGRDDYLRQLETIEETTPERIVHIDQLLTQFREMDHEAALIFELVYFTGLTTAECASVMEISLRTVARKLRIAKAWFLLKLTEHHGSK